MFTIFSQKSIFANSLNVCIVSDCEYFHNFETPLVLWRHSDVIRGWMVLLGINGKKRPIAIHSKHKGKGHLIKKIQGGVQTTPPLGGRDIENVSGGRGLRSLS